MYQSFSMRFNKFRQSSFPTFNSIPSAVEFLIPFLNLPPFRLPLPSIAFKFRDRESELRNLTRIERKEEAIVFRRVCLFAISTSWVIIPWISPDRRYKHGGIPSTYAQAGSVKVVEYPVDIKSPSSYEKASRLRISKNLEISTRIFTGISQLAGWLPPGQKHFRANRFSR